jgi:hypothetical protein
MHRPDILREFAKQIIVLLYLGISWHPPAQHNDINRLASAQTGPRGMLAKTAG